MTIARVHIAPGWGVNEKLTSAQCTAVDLNATYGLDKRTGQTDTLASTVTLTGSIAIAADAVVNCNGTSGHPGLININDQAECHVKSGGVVYVEGSGSLVCQSGASCLILAGATFTVGAASTFSGAMHCTSNAAVDGTLTVTTGIAGSPSSALGSTTCTGTLHVTGASTLNGVVTCTSNATVSGTLEVDTAITGNPTAALGSTAINGTLSGAIVETATTTRSGVGATTALRVTGTTDASQSFATPTDYDVYLLPASQAASRTYIMLGGGPDNVPVLVSRPSVSGVSWTIAITNGIFTLATFMSNAANPASITLLKVSGAWRVVSSSGIIGSDVSF